MFQELGAEMKAIFVKEDGNIIEMNWYLITTCFKKSLVGWPKEV